MTFFIVTFLSANIGGNIKVVLFITGIPIVCN
jgi:hypothetical protein